MENKSKILVVDDEQVNLKLLAAVFEPQGYEVMTASSGEAALGIVANCPPDLILLDVMMPGINGFEVLNRLRLNPATQLTPVVLVTSLKDTSDRVKGIDAGCDDFISKPFDRNELLARARSLLRIKALRGELEENYKSLQALERLKDSLIHMIVHDLNNPLTAISLKLQLMRQELEGKLSVEHTADFGFVLSAAQDLRRMINDLLDINKMEKDKIKLKLEKIDLAAAAKQVIDQMSAAAGEEDVRLALDVSAAAGDVVADKELIQRVIANLVSNAIKFSPSQGVVTVRILNGAGDGDISVQVKDGGPGIPSEYLDRVFEKFLQVQTPKVKAGRGLGLTFCKLAVEAHGGKVWVESELGKGCVFTFTIPREK